MKRILTTILGLLFCVIVWCTTNVLGGTGAWATASNWSQGTVPTASDGYVTTLNAGSPATCTVGANRVCNAFDCTLYTGTLAMSTFGITVSGSLTLGSGM